MAGPSWLAGAFAAIMIVIAVYCAGRLVASRLWHRATAVDADGLHVVMGVAMAGMLAPRLSLLPGSVWEGVFGGAAAWFAWQAARARGGNSGGGWRCHYPVPHLVECGAMLYMFQATPGTRPAGAGTGMPMPPMSAPPGSFPALALVLALFILGYIVWTTDRLTAGARANSATTARSTATDHARVLVTSGATAASPPDPPDPPDPPGTSGVAGTRQEQPASVPILAPRLAEFYKIAMGIAMGYMLILML